MTCEDMEVMYLEYEAALANNKTFTVSMVDTPNPLEGYIHPVSPLFYIHRTMVAASVLLVVASTFDNLRVINVYRHSGKKGFNYSALCLLFALLGNIFRLVVVIDPESLMGNISYDVSILAASLSDSCHVFSSLSSMVVWFDMIVGLLENAKLHFRTFVVTQMKSVRVVFFLVLTMLACFDAITSYNR